MKLFIAWIKKQLGIASPSTACLGYLFEYDYLKRKQRFDNFFGDDRDNLSQEDIENLQ